MGVEDRAKENILRTPDTSRLAMVGLTRTDTGVFS
jgi:hypothetical protein